MNPKIEQVRRLQELTKQKLDRLYELEQAMLEEEANLIVCDGGVESGSGGVGYHSRRMWHVIKKEVEEVIFSGTSDQVNNFFIRPLIKARYKGQKIFWRGSNMLIDV